MSTMTHVGSTKCATFGVDGEVFGVAVESVQEALMSRGLTQVPLAPRCVAGLLNLRGQIVSVISLREHLGLPPPDPADEVCLVVLRSSVRGTFVLVVDEIGEVHELASDGWIAPPPTLPAVHRALVRRIFPRDGGVVLGLHVDALFGDDVES
jgi:purine-binding chemotaxis protein CheW